MVGGSFSGSLVATEIGNAVDLNSVTTPGLYTQSSDAEAAAGTNYPALAPYAGVLEVFGVGAILSQRYSAYRNSDVNPTPNVWERTSVSGTWSAWQPLHYDTGWISTISSVATAATGWTLDEAYARRVNNTVWVRIVASRTGGTLTVTTSTDPTNTDVCTLLTRWRHTTPTQGLYSVTDRLSGCSVNSSGVVALFAAAPPTSIANTNQISVSGSYII